MRGILVVVAMLAVPASTSGLPFRVLQGTASQADTALESRVREVAATLRCPVCQNLSIQDSPSQLAQDMRKVVRERLAAGETPEQVRRYFVSRYGEWVLLKPRASGVNLSVWLLPLVMLLLGGTVIWVAVQRWVERGTRGSAPAPGAAGVLRDVGELRSRRSALQASLKELDSEFDAGRLSAADREYLRQRDQAELTAINEALKQQKKAALEMPAPTPAAAPATAETAGGRRVPAAVGWGAGVALFGVVAALSLKGSIVKREAGGSITGTQAGEAPRPTSGGGGGRGATFGEVGPLDSLRIAQLEARVRRDSTDEPALIELGHLYLTQGRLRESAQVNMKAVQLAPDAEGTAEAFAHMGMILWSTGELDGALRSLDKALYLHPDLPEALLYRGIIEFAGRRDMKEAQATFERYLAVAPPSANTARVKAMLEATRASQTP